MVDTLDPDDLSNQGAELDSSGQTKGREPRPFYRDRSENDYSNRPNFCFTQGKENFSLSPSHCLGLVAPKRAIRDPCSDPISLRFTFLENNLH